MKNICPLRVYSREEREGWREGERFKGIREKREREREEMRKRQRLKERMREMKGGKEVETV